MSFIGNIFEVAGDPVKLVGAPSGGKLLGTGKDEGGGMFAAFENASGMLQVASVAAPILTNGQLMSAVTDVQSISKEFAAANPNAPVTQKILNVAPRLIKDLQIIGSNQETIKRVVKSAGQEILEHFKQRKKEASSATRLVSRKTSLGDFVEKALVDAIAKKIPDAPAPEAQKTASKLVDLVTDMFQEIPDAAPGRSSQESQLHSQMNRLIQGAFSDEHGLENLGQIVGAGTGKVGRDLDVLKKDVEGFRDEVMPIVDSLRNAGNNQAGIAAFASSLTSRIPKIMTMVDGLNKDTAKLQAGIKANKDFSSTTVSKLVDKAQEIRENLGTMQEVPHTVEPIKMTLPDKVAEFTERATAASENLDGALSLRDNLLETFSPGKLFESNFSTLFSNYKTLSGAMSTASALVNSDTLRAVQTMAPALETVNQCMGLLSLLKDKEFQTQLKDMSQETNQKMRQWKQQASGADFGLSNLQTISRDVKGLINMGKKLVKGKVPSLAILDAIQSRLGVNFGGFIQKAESIISMVNSFKVPTTVTGQAFLGSLGQIAPATHDALIEGKVEKFTEALRNPSLMTRVGAAIVGVQEWVKEMGTDLSTEDRGIAAGMMSFLKGQHTKHIMSTLLGNIPARRKKTLQEIETTVSMMDSMAVLVKQLMKKGF